MKKRSVEEYFIEQLKYNNSNIAKEDILNVALECTIDIKPRLAKSKIIDMIVDYGGYDKLFEYFNEFITIPAWEVAEYYGIAKYKIKQLGEIGIITEEPITKKFYSCKDRGYFNEDTYPLSVLKYDLEELLNAYERAFGGNTYNLRIETKSEEDAKPLNNVLERVFKMDKLPVTYENKNEDGYFTYYNIKLLNGSKEEENKFLAEISRLKLQQEEIAKQSKEQVESILNILKDYLGEDVNRINLTERLDKLFKSEVNKLNYIPVKNERNAGRKPKFDKSKIIGMEIMKENGYSYNEIAKEYNTTKATVIKYLKKRK